MKTILQLICLSTVTLTLAEAASIKLQSREFLENKKGEIIEVDATIINSKGAKVSESAPSVASIRGAAETFISTQHILIPATSEVRQALLNAHGAIQVEGSILDEQISESENTTFKQIKVLVREIE